MSLQVAHVPAESVLTIILDRAEGVVSARGRGGKGRRSDCGSAVSSKQVEAYVSQVR
jgi:hypothetical protein